MRTYTAEVTDSRGLRYAIAGALAVTTADLLQHVHRVAGCPGFDAAGLTPQRRALSVAAIRARSAAAAVSAVVSRLLLLEREAARTQLPEIGRPDVAEPGVTILPGLERATARVSLLAVSAAGAELASARDAWAQWEGAGARDVVGVLDRLIGYVEQLAATFEEPELAAEPPATA